MEVDGSSQEARRVEGNALSTRDDPHELQQDETETVGKQQWIVDAAAIEGAHQETLAQHTNAAHDDWNDDERQPEIAGKAQREGTDIGAQHEELAVREIHNRQKPKDQR